LGFWMHFLEARYGNPFFPYFNDIFKSPFAPLTSARDLQYIQHGWRDKLLYPFVFAASPFRTGEIVFRDWRIPILYVLLPLAVIVRLGFGRTKKRQDAVTEPFTSTYLLWAASLSYAGWLLMFCIYRYAIPLEMLAPLLIVLAAAMLPLKPQTRGLIACFLLVVVAASIQPGNWSRRESWSEHFVEADIPPLDLKAEPMLLMAGFEPYSHVVPLFPPEIPVVRIQSNFASPDEGKPVNAVIAERLKSHKGAFLLLIPPYQMHFAKEALAYFHLALSPEPCQKVIDRLYGDSELSLCPVKRL